ncbi:MAG TPA: glutamate racemase [Myxococcota bacterium]|nr:glutamate racemase [Myxococcota bacterium]
MTGRLGVFDSGFGGLTVLADLMAAMPQTDFLYLGDNARYPYGTRGFDTVLEFTTEAVDYLFRRGCPVVLLACNTASAKALRTIQQQFLPARWPDRRVLGVVRPSVEALAELPPGAIPGVTVPGNATGNVAILATPGTVASRSFVMELEKLAPGINVVQQACPMWVPLVENGELDGPGCRYFVRKYLDPVLNGPLEISRMLLACTHYPLLLDRISEITPPDVQILTQGKIVAERMVDWLTRHPDFAARLSSGGGSWFLTTDDTARFNELATMFMTTPVVSEHVHLPRLC